MTVYCLYERVIKPVAGKGDEVAAIGAASGQNLVNEVDGVSFFSNVRRQFKEWVLLQMLFECDDGSTHLD